MKPTKKEIGRIGEDAVCARLTAQGYTIVGRNFCVVGGEVDIIARNQEYLVFVEVKTRQSPYITEGYAAVTKRKQRRIIETAVQFAADCPADLGYRFDVACVGFSGRRITQILYVENAFDATGTDIYI